MGGWKEMCDFIVCAVQVIVRSNNSYALFLFLFLIVGWEQRGTYATKGNTFDWKRFTFAVCSSSLEFDPGLWFISISTLFLSIQASGSER
jgi:hypothetical protein